MSATQAVGGATANARARLRLDLRSRSCGMGADASFAEDADAGTVSEGIDAFCVLDRGWRGLFIFSSIIIVLKRK